MDEEAQVQPELASPEENESEEIVSSSPKVEDGENTEVEMKKEGQEEEVKENQEIQEENMETPEEEAEGDVVTTNPVSSNEIRQYDVKRSHPVLNGHFINDGENCIWTGLWGMGTEGVIRGVSSDFRFVMKLPEDDQIHEGPQDGVYNGYFWMRTNPPQRISENNVQLTFTQEDSSGSFTVKGEGQNRLGLFDLIGTYTPTTSKMTCEKFYLGVKSTVHTKASRKANKSKSEALWTQSRVPSTPTVMSTRSGSTSSSYLRTSSIVPRGLTKEMSLCYKCVKKLMTHKWAGPFIRPVDPVALNIPDYYTIVKEPMDFSTICKYIENQVIVTKADFDRHMNLVFDNALLYNKEGSDVNIMAHTLKEVFEKESNAILGQIYAAGEDAFKSGYFVPTRRTRTLAMDDYQDVNKIMSKKPRIGMEKAKSSKKVEMEKMASLIQQLQGTASRLEREINDRLHKNEKSVVDTRPMTVEEKKALSLEINQLKGSDLEGIVSIIRANTPVDQMNQGDIEIDLDTMPNEVLRKMEKHIKDCKAAKVKHRKHRKPYTHTPREKTIDFDDNVYIEEFDETEDSVQEEY